MSQPQEPMFVLYDEITVSLEVVSMDIGVERHWLRENRIVMMRRVEEIVGLIWVDWL